MPLRRPPCPALLVLLCACAPGSGLNGPALPEPVSGTGPCFEADITDGLQGGDEILLLFECFNGHGAFAPLAPTVEYLAQSPLAEQVGTAVVELDREVDLAATLQTGANLLSSPDQPLQAALDVYVEAYEVQEGTRTLMGSALGIGWEAMDSMAACEASADPDACSLPRLARRVLETDLVDQATLVMEAAQGAYTEEEQAAYTRTMIQVVYDNTTAAGQDQNPLLSLAHFMMDDGGKAGQSPIERLLPYLQYLVSRDLDGDGSADRNPDNDDLVGGLVREYARLWRDGTLSALPDMMTTLYTTNAKGQEVGWDGVSIIDELLAVGEDLGGDPALLYEEITLPTGKTTTMLELALDTVDDIYVNDQDVGEIVSTLEDMVADLCDGASNDLCDIAEDALPPLSAAARTGITDVLLPAVYVMHQMVDFQVLFDLSELALELELMERTQFFTRISLENGLMERSLQLFPVFVVAGDGELSAEGEAALELVDFAIRPWSADGGPELTPILVPRALIARVLDPQYPSADLDWVLGQVTLRLLDEESALHLDNLEALGAAFDAASEAEPLDPIAEARTLLANEPLWTSALQLGADRTLVELLSPADGVEGPAWYLYDLIQRDVLDRMLALAAAAMDLVNGDSDSDTATP